MKLIIYLFFLSIFIVGCSQTENIKSVKTLLTNDSIKYWDLVKRGKHSVDKNLVAISFDKFNNYYSYSFTKKGAIKKDVMEDVIYEDVYDLIDQNNLLINYTFEFEILKITNDTLIIRNKNYKKQRFEYLSRRFN